MAPDEIQLSPVFQTAHTALAGAVDAAEHFAFGFDAVADNLASAVRAGWRDHVNRAFEAVERLCLSLGRDLKRFIVIISAHVAFSHNVSSLSSAEESQARSALAARNQNGRSAFTVAAVET